MAPKFGTSGLRGLVTDLTEDLVKDYTRAFLAACPQGPALYVGHDLRPSSPRIAAWVMAAAEDAGIATVDCGTVPTPALALASMNAACAAVMVTGSHIPADRNGLKFYVPAGEISKNDEARILGSLGQRAKGAHAGRRTQDATGAYVRRYLGAFGDGAFQGLTIGVYQHSSVARQIMVDVVTALGGTPVPLAPSDSFVPVDTEALDTGTREMLAGWCREHALDAVISTDGDADRPMVADAEGRIVPGDVLGALTAQALGAQVLCTPVSSNTNVDSMDGFTAIVRTRIGSPFVIAAMEAVLAEDPQTKVVGYEANGGFLLGFEASGPAGPIGPLMTRDSLLPIVAPLAAARAQGVTLADLAAGLPPRFTAADRIAGIATDVSQAFLAETSENAEKRRDFFPDMGAERGVDLTDGLRVTFGSGEVVHLRPSGNAPEFRCYAEADSAARADALVAQCLARLREELG